MFSTTWKKSIDLSIYRIKKLVVLSILLRHCANNKTYQDFFLVKTLTNWEMVYTPLTIQSKQRLKVNSLEPLYILKSSIKSALFCLSSRV